MKEGPKQRRNYFPKKCITSQTGVSSACCRFLPLIRLFFFNSKNDAISFATWFQSTLSSLLLSSNSLMLAMLFLVRVHDAEDKVDNDSQQKDNGQDRGAEAVIKASLAPHAYRLGTPVVGDEGVDHGEHGDAGEEKGGDEGDPVAKVEHANGQGADDDGEVEP